MPGDDESESRYTIGNVPVDGITEWVVIIAYKYYDERDVPKYNQGYSGNHYPCEDENDEED